MNEIRNHATQVMSKLEELKTSKSARSTIGECYICHDPGHYARNCPERKIRRKTSDECYRCGQEGLWAKDCPEKQGITKNTSNKPCFKFGEKGNWYQDFPENKPHQEHPQEQELHLKRSQAQVEEQEKGIG